jgi:hypothetical protein
MRIRFHSLSILRAVVVSSFGELDATGCSSGEMGNAVVEFNAQPLDSVQAAAELEHLFGYAAIFC